MAYVDGFVLAVPKGNLEDYRKMATLGRDVWMSHGALDYKEWVGDDVPEGEVTSFPRSVMMKDDETVIFSWITFKDRASRDEINAKVMADPRMNAYSQDSMPFDGKRMIFGGFTTFVD
jgi:uncharacterized protein YbaA (DUF1428 family)